MALPALRPFASHFICHPMLWLRLLAMLSLRPARLVVLLVPPLLITWLPPAGARAPRCRTAFARSSTRLPLALPASSTYHRYPFSVSIAIDLPPVCSISTSAVLVRPPAAVQGPRRGAPWVSIAA